jgi:hypothetical protein
MNVFHARLRIGVILTVANLMPTMLHHPLTLLVLLAIPLASIDRLAS